MILRKRKYLYQNRLNFQEYSHFNTRKTKTHTGFVEKGISDRLFPKRYDVKEH